MTRERKSFINRNALRKQRRQLGALAAISTLAMGGTVAYATREGEKAGSDSAPTAESVAKPLLERNLTSEELRKINKYNDTPLERKTAVSIMRREPQQIYDGRLALEPFTVKDEATNEERTVSDKLISPVLVQVEPLKIVGRGQNLTNDELLSGSFAFATLEDKEGVPAVGITHVTAGMELEPFTPRHEGQPLVISAVLGGGAEGQAFRRGVDESGDTIFMHRTKRHFAFYLPAQR